MLVKQEIIENKNTVTRKQHSTAQMHTDISETIVREPDVISQLRANLSQLEDLHGRLRFLMSDVRTIIQKKA